MSSEQIHGTCISIDGKGILLRGGSGAGKSDLALRLISAGAVLVGDDRVDVSFKNGALIASPPAALAGKLEVRGVGIVPQPFEENAPLLAVIDLVPPERVERMPEPEMVEILGVPLPLWRFAPFESSAVEKVILASKIAAGFIIAES